MNKRNFLVIDIGSTYTKLRLFRDAVLMAGVQVPTTLHNIVEGIRDGQIKLNKFDQLAAAGQVEAVATSSAAGGLRIVAMGYMTRVTAKAAKEVAMNAGARVLEVISQDHDVKYRMEILKEIAPDIVLLAGGTDSGNEASLEENALVLADSGISTKVVLSGNRKAQPRAAEILESAGIEYIKVPNIMPTIHELIVREAREAIHREFIEQITDAEGLAALKQMLTNKIVTPTPGAVLMGAELLSRGFAEQTGTGDLLVIDLGGATTDVHSILPCLDELPLEEKGLIVTNEKQAVYRTVEGNLGMRVSAEGILESVGPDQLLIRRSCFSSEKASSFKEYVKKISKKTSHIPQNSEEEFFDSILAETAVEIALKRHAGYFSQEANPVMGIAPGMPVGRDLRMVRKIVCVGGYFQQNVSIVKQMVTNILRNRGISLLPDSDKVDVITDADYIFFAAGAISACDQSYAMKILRTFI